MSALGALGGPDLRLTAKIPVQRRLHVEAERRRRRESTKFRNSTTLTLRPPSPLTAHPHHLPSQLYTVRRPHTRSIPHLHTTTMVSTTAALLLSGAAFLHVQAQTIPVTDLVGTWSSKSNATFTGDVCIPSAATKSTWANKAPQGFYDPVNEKMFEPKHTGISYSFTADGYFESAYYRAIANRT